MTLPNFLIVGAAKSGTTTLFDCLSQHPDIFMSRIKDPNFFSSGWPHWVETEADYISLFKDWSGQKRIGEASTAYLDDPDAPYRIKSLLGSDCKIIISLRNPADRAYSQWGHAFYHEGFEKLPFEKALTAESLRMSKIEELKKLPNYYPGLFQYFGQGLYAGKIKHYFDFFGRENVLVLIFEEFLSNPWIQLEKIYAFLNVKLGFKPVLGNKNPPRRSRLVFLSDFLQTPPVLLSRIYQKLPPKMKQLIYSVARRLYWANQRPRVKVSFEPALREKLIKDYLYSIYDLEKLLGRDLSIWYKELVNQVSAE